MRELTYYRSSDGKRWHRPGCYTLGPFPTKWEWARGKTGREITADLKIAGLHLDVLPCLRCKPNEVA